MPVASRIRFVPYEPHVADLLTGGVHRSKRDIVRSELSAGLNAALALATGIADMGMPYTAEEYARIVIWCLGWMLDGWPHDITFTNLSNIKGGIRPLQRLKGRLENGTLRFVRAPQDVRSRALHDPESVLPDAMSAAALALALALVPETLSPTLTPCFEALAPHPVARAPDNSEPPSAAASVPAPRAEELVLHPDTLEPILSLPLGPDGARGAHERRQRCDVKKARHRPTGRKSHSRMVGTLTSRYVLDSPQPSGPSTIQRGPRGNGMPVIQAPGPLAEQGLPLMVDEFVGDYVSVPGA